MPKPEASVVTLVGVFIAAALFGRLGIGSSPWNVGFAGLVLLIILFAYDGDRGRTFWQSAAFAAVCGYCALLTSAPVLNLVAPQASGWVFYAPLTRGTAELPQAGYLPTLVWIGGTILFLIIDRARMNAAPAPAPVFPQPVFAQPVAQPNTAPAEEAVSATPTVSEAPQEISPQPVATPPPNAVVLPLGAGKPATIYLNLIGEGLACLRPVQAEHLGRDFYRIVEQVPEGEQWEYQPGQVVRAQKKNLSSGKALVAVEEAPRAR